MNKLGVFPLLFLILLTLKLTNLTDWPWVAVCSPIIALVIFYSVAFVIGIFVTAKHLRSGD